MGPRAGLEGENSRPHRDSIPDRPALASRYTDRATGPLILIIISLFNLVLQVDLSVHIVKLRV